MSTTIVFQENVRIPEIVDIDSFRQWAKSGNFPDRGRYSYLKGELWIDLMTEQLFSHNDVKMEFAEIIRGLLKRSRRGRFFGDRTLVTNVKTGLSTEPDGTIAMFTSLKKGRVSLVEGADEGFNEIMGSPDMVLEVVSPTSVQKDTVMLRELFWESGIPEYWLVDARGDRLQFEILKHGRKGYISTRIQSGWVRSVILDKSFRLTRSLDAIGNPEYALSVR